VTDLTAAGVAFTRYPWMQLADDALPIWVAPGGTQIAWMYDPFGNVLSLQQDLPHRLRRCATEIAQCATRIAQCIAIDCAARAGSLRLAHRLF
jgi:hypothetical protein